MRLWNQKKKINEALKFFKIFAFFLFNPDEIWIVRADSFGGAAGGGAALEQARPKAELIK